MKQLRAAIFALGASWTIASAAGSCGPTARVTATSPGTRAAICAAKNGLPDGIQTAAQDAREDAAANACHRTELSNLSELPPDLANAGCTGFASYQLGLRQKPARYAICPAVTGSCPG